jgi:hypothetical protein
MRTLLVAGIVALTAVVAAPARAPKARFKATPKSPVVGQRVKLDASASKCRHCRYQWRMLSGRKTRKLGKKSSGKVLRYRFRSAGVKRIRLTVTDRKGHRARVTHRIRVRPRGAAPLLPPSGAPVERPGAPPGTPPGQPGPRRDCFPDPSSCGYPDADNTGPSGALQSATTASLPSGAAWDAGTKTLRITGDNVLIQNLDVPGPIAVDGNNATIQNSRIHVDEGCSSPCGSYGIRLGETDALVSGTVLQNLDIVTDEKNPADDKPLDPSTIDTKLDHGVRNNGDEQVVADKLYIKGFAGAWKGPGTIRNSYLFSQLVFDGDHVEAYLNGGEGDPSILQHDTILNPVAQTAAISFFNDFGGIGKVTVEDNLLAGGGYVMYGGAKNGTGNVDGPILVRDNRIARGDNPGGDFLPPHGYYRNGGEIGLWAEFNRSATTACDNYWDDTLSPTEEPEGKRC